MESRTALRRHAPANGDLAEALFALAETEPPGERRLAFLKAGYAAFDAPVAARRMVEDSAPAWLRPIVTQLAQCRGRGALDAAVQRLSSGGTPRRRATRERYLSRADVAQTLASGNPDLHPSRLRGAFHWHTTASDGRAALETMARAALRSGATWAVVTDHSRGLEVASGLDPEGVRLQRRAVERWNRFHGESLRLYQGLEVEILEDGTLDVPRGERLDVDCIVAAVHRQFDPERDQTERLLRAIATPGVHALAHPRGRHFHHRPGLKVRWETVFAACAERGVVVEINGFPRRQDLDWELARLAAEAGCTFVLSSDAHATTHLEFVAYASAIAMRAELDPGRVLNLLQPDDVEVWLEG